jgi:hypothetical protein
MQHQSLLTDWKNGVYRLMKELHQLKEAHKALQEDHKTVCKKLHGHHSRAELSVGAERERAHQVVLGINPARVCAAGRVRVLCAASRECVEPSGPWRVACVRARASRRVRVRART